MGRWTHFLSFFATFWKYHNKSNLDMHDLFVAIEHLAGSEHVWHGFAADVGSMDDVLLSARVPCSHRFSSCHGDSFSHANELLRCGCLVGSIPGLKHLWTFQITNLIQGILKSITPNCGKKKNERCLLCHSCDIFNNYKNITHHTSKLISPLSEMCDATILLTNVHKLSLSTRPYRHFLFNALDCSLKRSGTASSFVFHSFDRLQQGCHICHHHLEKTENIVFSHIQALN